MVTRTGILSDAYFNLNCVEYVGQQNYKNATFVGNFKNSFLNGVKTPISQRAAFQSSSPDVEAVNLSKYYKGNVYANANKILDQMSDRVKQYNILESKYKPLQEFKKVDEIMLGDVKAIKKNDLGDLLTKHTIGYANDSLKRDDYELASGNSIFGTKDVFQKMFLDLRVKDQQSLIKDVQYSAKQQNIDINEYSKAKYSQGNKNFRATNISNILEIIAVKNGALPDSIIAILNDKMMIPHVTNSQMGNDQGILLNLMTDLLPIETEVIEEKEEKEGIEEIEEIEPLDV